MRFHIFASCGQYASDDRYWTVRGPVRKKIIRNFGLRLHQAYIEGDMEEYSINYIDVVRIDTWPRRRGSILTNFDLFC